MADEKETKDTTSDEVEDEDLDVEDDTKETTYDKKYVDSLKTEAKTRRLKLRDVEAELKKLQGEKLTDSEKKDAQIKKLEKDVLELTSESKNIKLDSMIMGIASTKGFADLDTVLLIAKKELASEEDIDSKLVEKVIDKIVKDKPFLLASEDTKTPSPGSGEKQDMEAAKDPDKMFGDFIHDRE